MRFRCSSEYEMTVDQFWNDIFFEDAFNAYLYHEGLGFSRFEIIEQSQSEGGAIRRVVKAYPHIEVPGPLRRILGNNIHYFERGEYDPEKRHWKCSIEIPRLSSKLKINSDMWLVDREEGGSIRHVDFDVQIRILGMRRILGHFTRSSLEETYTQAAHHTNMWFRQLMASKD